MIRNLPLFLSSVQEAPVGTARWFLLLEGIPQDRSRLAVLRRGRRYRYRRPVPLARSMIRPGFLDSKSCRDLIGPKRDGLAEHCLARRANALVLLDNGMIHQSDVAALLLDDDAIRTWYQTYQEDGIEGPAGFGHEGEADFLENARHDNAKLVQAWLTQPDRRIKLHLIPAYCPHLNPIERLLGLMRRHPTKNKYHGFFRNFSINTSKFLRDDMPRNWRINCDDVTGNIQVIDPNNAGLSYERGV